MAIKKIRVLGLETHQRKLKNGSWNTSGVDFARIINPLTHLAKHPDFEVELRKEPFTENEKNWDEITKSWDIIYTSYIDSPEGYVNMAFWANRNGCQIVIDIDDNVFELDPANPVYNAYHYGSEKLHFLASILEHTQHLTVSTQILQRKIVQMTKRSYDFTKVLPNFIDLELYDYSKRVPKKNDKITILHAGSSTHFKDLMEKGFVTGLSRVLKENKNAEFITIGNWIPQLQTMFGPQYRQIQGKPDVYEWIDDLYPRVIGMTDVVVVPLKNDNHTKCKSAIKFLEFSAGKVPGVYQKISQYEEHIKFTDRGLLAETGNEWYSQITKLVKDAELRKSMGNSAFEYVKDKQTIQSNIEKYAEYFKSVSRTLE